MRTFIAVELSDEMRLALIRVERSLRGHLRRAGVTDGVLRWAGAEKAHVTLRFLGETDTDQVERVKGGLVSVLRGQAPFGLRLADLGCFPSCARPRVVWTGITGDLAALAQLQARTEQVAQAAGFPAETRPFSPHITLARAGRRISPQQQRQLGQVLTAFRTVSPLDLSDLGTVRVDAVILMHSELWPTGSVYTPLGRFAFTDRNESTAKTV